MRCITVRLLFGYSYMQ